jgi:cephalosporin-C deacetylase-like acetyl esterase
VLVVFCIASALGASDDFAELAKLYSYDRSVPVDVKARELLRRAEYRVFEISYANPKSGRTTGYLVAPVTTGRKPGIIWMHSGGPVSRMGDAALMAEAGAVSLLVNPPGPPAPSGNDPEGWRDYYVQAVIGLRRAVDVLCGRADVDCRRIGFVRHSFGAMMGAFATSVDTRFRAAVFEVGLLGMSIHIAHSSDPWAESLRREMGDGLPHFLQVISTVDATHYVGHAPRIPKLFQSAYFDHPAVPREASESFFQAATDPKQLNWYDTGHDVDSIGAIADRANFLGVALGLEGIGTVLQHSLGVKQSKPAKIHPPD